MFGSSKANCIGCQCPPEGFSSATSFSLDRYVGAPWYVQQQQEVSYLPRRDNFCVRARYEKQADGSVQVNNYSNRDKVNGTVKKAILRATVPNRNVESQLKVGPSFLPSFFYGPYWVIAAGLYPTFDSCGTMNMTPDCEAPYQWALISGGPPKHPGENGKCRTGSGVNGSGLWIFTRDPVVDERIVEMIRSIAHEKGFDLSVLNPVIQEGCLYNDAP